MDCLNCSKEFDPVFSSAEYEQDFCCRSCEIMWDDFWMLVKELINNGEFPEAY